MTEETLNKIFVSTADIFSDNLNNLKDTLPSDYFNNVKKYHPRYLSLEYTWHGGEPLLAGQEFYARAIEMQSCLIPKEIHTSNKIQTNGTLINKSVANFFKKNNFVVGVSLDGPEYVNKNRVYRNKKSSFADVVANIKLLQKAEVTHGVLATITPDTVKNITPAEFMSFFGELGSNLQVNVFYPVGRGLGLSCKKSDSQEIAKFLFDCFKIYLENKTITIKDFDSYIDALFLNQKLPYCRYTGSCITKENMFGFDYNGDVYLCNRFIGLDKYKFGNINEVQSLNEFSDKKQKLYKNYKPNKKNCISCQMAKNEICGQMGGCIFAQELLGYDPLCLVTKQLSQNIAQYKKEYYMP